MKNKNKIDWLIILPTDSLGGGAEQLLFNFTTFLCSKGLSCKVIILTNKITKGWSPLEKKCVIKYLPFNNVYFGYLTIIPILIKISFTHEINQTFSSQTLINGLLGFIKKIGFLKNSKIIVRESNSIFHLLKGFKLKIYKAAYSIGYSEVAIVICQTSFMKDQLIEALPWMKDKLKIIVLDNPINLDLINHNSIEKIEALEDLKFIVAAGRLSPVKGFDILINSFYQIHEQHPSLKLLILGEGKERENLEMLINELDMGDKIKLIGFVKNVYPYFKAAQLCVMSSRIEGFPNVLLQMMSQNTKVVSTLSAGGISDVIGIYTCPINDVIALSEIIEKCLTSDTEINRKVFDINLKNRTFDTFLSKINDQISNSNC